MCACQRTCLTGSWSVKPNIQKLGSMNGQVRNAEEYESRSWYKEDHVHSVGRDVTWRAWTGHAPLQLPVQDACGRVLPQAQPCPPAVVKQASAAASAASAPRPAAHPAQPQQLQARAVRQHPLQLGAVALATKLAGCGTAASAPQRATPVSALVAGGCRLRQPGSGCGIARAGQGCMLMHRAHKDGHRCVTVSASRPGQSAHNSP